MSRWDQFEKYCIALTPVLEAISRNGLGIDPARQQSLFETLTRERDGILAAIQTAIPTTVLKEKTWKRAPKVMTDDMFLRTNAETGAKEWYRRLPFSPRSWQQVQQLAVALGVKLPRKQDAESEDDTSTDDKALKRAAKKHKVFADIREYRKRDKLITAYQWPLDAHNRVHPTFAFHPSTWRKSCRNPNIQTIPKRSDLAKAFRKMIVPRPGNVLIEGDSAAIEAVIVGALAGSDRYIRLARAGVHGWITSALHGKPISLDISDAALTAACQQAKREWPDDYEKCKRVVHLCLTGDHEVLTLQGWKRLDALAQADQVAQWTEGGRIDFVEPQQIISMKHEGEMIHFCGQAIEQVVTANHGMPVSVDHTMRVRKVLASEVRDKDFLPLTGVWKGGTLSPFPVQVALAVVVQADGSIVGQTCKVKLKRQRKIERLLTLLGSHEYPHKVKEYRDGTTVIKFPLSLLGDAVDLLNIKKEFTWKVLGLSPLSREIFLSELPHWDGSYEQHFRHKRVQYNTKIKRNAEIVQTLAHLSGRQGLLRPQLVAGNTYWVVSLNRRQFAYSRPIKKVASQYKGEVWCLTVPSGYFMVRYGGKVSVTGNSNYCGTPRRIAEEYPDEFPKESDAAKLQNFYFETDAGRDIRAWQKQTVEIAHANKGLENHFGLRHRFYALYSYDSRRACYVLGDDAKRAVAFVPQSDASFVQSDILLRLVARDERFLQWIVAIIHDSIVLDLPASLADYAAAVLHEEMVRALPQLDNLWIGSEIKIGVSLGEMEVWKPCTSSATLTVK